MRLLIDGYNLLQATGLFGSPDGPPTLERSRGALLDFLAASLREVDACRTTVVFDAAAAPPGLPSVMSHEGITIRFSRRKGTADDLIEELIEAEADPRTLTVVSSDHRIQRAARRRRAGFVDSEAWYRVIKTAAYTERGAGGSDAAASDKPSLGGLANPFPPGYVEEVEREAKGL